MSTTVTQTQAPAHMEMTSDATKNHASNDSKVRVVPNGSTEHIAAAQSRDTAGTEAASQDSDSITGWRLVFIAISLLLSIFLV